MRVPGGEPDHPIRTSGHRQDDFWIPVPLLWSDGTWRTWHVRIHARRPSSIHEEHGAPRLRHGDVGGEGAVQVPRDADLGGGRTTSDLGGNHSKPQGIQRRASRDRLFHRDVPGVREPGGCPRVYAHAPWQDRRRQRVHDPDDYGEPPRFPRGSAPGARDAGVHRGRRRPLPPCARGRRRSRAVHRNHENEGDEPSDGPHPHWHREERDWGTISAPSGPNIGASRRDGVVHLAGPLGVKDDESYRRAYWRYFDEFFGKKNAGVIKAMLLAKNAKADTGDDEIDRVCYGLRQTMGWLAEAIERKALSSVPKQGMATTKAH